jgi:hypothetical protein
MSSTSARTLRLNKAVAEVAAAAASAAAAAAASASAAAAVTFTIACKSAEIRGCRNAEVKMEGWGL